MCEHGPHCSPEKQFLIIIHVRTLLFPPKIKFKANHLKFNICSLYILFKLSLRGKREVWLKLASFCRRMYFSYFSNIFPWKNCVALLFDQLLIHLIQECFVPSWWKLTQWSLHPYNLDEQVCLEVCGFQPFKIYYYQNCIMTRDLKGMRVDSPCDNLFLTAIDIPDTLSHYKWCTSWIRF